MDDDAIDFEMQGIGMGHSRLLGWSAKSQPTVQSQTRNPEWKGGWTGLVILKH